MIMAEVEFAWEVGRSYRLSLRVEGDRLVGAVDDATFFDIRAEGRLLEGGAVALVCVDGEMEAGEVTIRNAE